LTLAMIIHFWMLLLQANVSHRLNW
jgi:hypothetical protein